jgi:cation:H+ antiporter
MLLALALLVGGGVLLTIGADRLVVAAVHLSRIFGVTPTLIGALVIGLGTSLPELLVSFLASSRGELDIAIGNIVGSNVSNVTLVLGAAVLFAPIRAQARILRREGILMFGSLILLALVLADLFVHRWEGLMLAAGMVFAASRLVTWSNRDGLDEATMAEIQEGIPQSGLIEAVFAIGSLVATVAGAELLLRGAIRLANEAGITESFVGLIILAVGTSLPELATALAAGRRGQAELIVGNILGSNLFNSLFVGGFAGIAGSGRLAGTFGIAIAFMLGSALLAGLFALTGRKIVRGEGIVLLAVFAAFVVASY